MNTVWLENAELGYSVAPPNARLADLAYSAMQAGRWIDQTRVAGNPEAESTARRALRLLTREGDFSLLVGPAGGLLGAIRSSTVRLKGLLQ